MKKILEPVSSRHWSALRAVIGIERGIELSLIIDGPNKIEYQKYEFIRELCVFTEQLRKILPTRVLLTSRPQAEIKEILGQLPSVEYGGERKGLTFLFFILKTNKVAKNCKLSHQTRRPRLSPAKIDHPTGAVL